MAQIATAISSVFANDLVRDMNDLDLGIDMGDVKVFILCVNIQQYRKSTEYALCVT
jgi:hypothetical protein